MVRQAGDKNTLLSSPLAETTKRRIGITRLCSAMGVREGLCISAVANLRSRLSRATRMR